VAAFIVCWKTAPWGQPESWAPVIVLLSAIPLACLQFLGIHIFRNYKRIQGELNEDLERAEISRLFSRTTELHNEMRHARGASILRRDRTALTATDSPHIFEAPRKSNLTQKLEQYVSQRYVAGEDLRLDEVDKHLHEIALDQVQPLHRDHELAFLIGLAGTVLGLVVQISLMQSSVLDKTFLTGVVVKACATLMGILVALYARSLRQRLLEDYDELVATLIQFTSFYIAPWFVEINSERAAVSEVLRRTIDEFKHTVDRVKTDLSDALATAVETASNALGKRLKETFATELAESIREQITKPFHAEIERLRTAISQSGDSITDGVRGLKDGAREFKDEYSTLARASTSMGTQLRDSGNVLKSLTDKFEELITQSDSVAQKLKESAGELALAVERSQNNHSGHNGNWMKGELEKLLDDNRKDRQVHAALIDKIAVELHKPKRNS
jgi:hypothetical protein